jgi:hypothetical protein
MLHAEQALRQGIALTALIAAFNSTWCFGRNREIPTRFPTQLLITGWGKPILVGLAKPEKARFIAAIDIGRYRLA